MRPEVTHRARRTSVGLARHVVVSDQFFLKQHQPSTSAAAVKKRILPSHRPPLVCRACLMGEWKGGGLFHADLVCRCFEDRR
jgi:hypothetical protein